MRRSLDVFSYILTLILAIFCIKALAEESKPNPDKDLPSVAVRALKTEVLFDVFTYPARVFPKVNATLLSDSDGVVSKVYAAIGARVKKGERLVMTINSHW